jgi:hypothetical protein
MTLPQQLILRRKWSRRRELQVSRRRRSVLSPKKGPDDEEPAGKRARIDPVAETDEDVDILSTPRIEPLTYYPPKGKVLKIATKLPATSLVDAEELETRDAQGKRVAEMILKQIAMASSALKERVAGLVDVIDVTEELCYIDDDTPTKTMEEENSVLKPLEGPKESTMGLSQS